MLYQKGECPVRHFIDLHEWSSKDLWRILQLAVHLKAEWRSGGNRPVLHGKTLAMIFQKPSLRTRVSFDVAMQHLGGYALMLGPDEIGLGKRESVADVARVLAGYTQIIAARVFAHQHVCELAQYARVPVINMLSDNSHPCQAMADVLTVYEHFGQLKGLKIAFIGDGNNVAASLLEAAAHFGMHFTIATPRGYELPAHVWERVKGLAAASGATYQAFVDPHEAARGAHVVYTDTWVSMGQEKEAAERVATMRPYQVNQGLLASADAQAVVLHCLPAHRGDEITDEVADGPQSLIFPQAENRLHAQKAILVDLMTP
ncbi:MAG: ornithine carbamoyltransferase [Chloroflexi bacterium]|nr:ornithine carbamoyltransferase [Chloroflexota bacterium]